MAEDRIDSIVDRPAIKADMDFISAELKQLIALFEQAKNSAIAIGHAQTVSGAGKAIRSNANDNVALQESIKAVNALVVQYQASLAKLTTAQTQMHKDTLLNRQELQKLNKELKTEIEYEKAAAGSIEKARAAVKGLTAERNKLNLETAEGQRQLKKLNAEIDRNNALIEENGDKNLKRVFNIGKYAEGVAGGIRNITSGLLASVGITAGLSGVFDFLKDASAEFDQAEQASSRLKNTLDNLGRIDVFDRMADSADRLAEEFKTIDNDEIIESFQQLVTYGKLTENQMNDLLPIIINFAAKSGTSIQDSTGLIIKALEGNGKALKEYGINIKDGATVTERLGIVMDELAPKVEGAAKAFGETTQGQIKATTQEINNLKEEIGSKLQPVIQGFYFVISNALSGFQIFFQNIGAGISATVKTAQLGFGILKDIASFNPAGAAQRLATAKLENEQLKKNFEDEQSLNQKRVAAQSFVANAAKLPLAEQKKLLAENQALLAGSRKIYESLGKGAKMSAAEARKAKLQFIEDADIVLGLQNNIARAQDKTILGVGDPDKSDKAPTKLKVVKDHLNDILRSLKELGTKGKEDLDRFKLAGFTGPGGEAAPKAKTFAPDTSAAYDKELERKQKRDAIAYAKEQEALAHKYEYGLISKEKYEKDLLTIQEKYTVQSLRALIESEEHKLKFGFEGVEQTQELADKKLTIEEKIEKLKQELADKTRTKEKKTYSERLKDLEEFFSAATEITGAIGQTLTEINGIGYDRKKAQNEQAIADIEKRSQAEINAINELLITEDEKNARINKANILAQKQKEEIDRKNRRLEAEKAKFDKAANIANIISSTALAVVKALSTQPAYLGIALAAIVGALGAAQLARAINTPIPAYKYGKSESNKYEGPAKVGDGGKREPILRADGTLELSPAKTTMTYVGRDDIVYPDINTFLNSITRKQTDKILSNSHLAGVRVNVTPQNNDDVKKELKQVVSAIERIQQPVIQRTFDDVGRDHETAAAWAAYRAKMGR